ncbi:hypothetical protein PANDA_008232 [Ailuropoda melanoleuca]|uniref:Uncharacterized protein n=1 Tax=Ailuropoda melanoleuca TaxID=9646 RepID=D2HCC6_AILME|nr:hypothetical protein PANDA_008232 [Ailuropoda melanoleuca]
MEIREDRERARLDSMVLLIMKLDQLDQDIENALSTSSSPSSTPTNLRRHVPDLESESESGADTTSVNQTQINLFSNTESTDLPSSTPVASSGTKPKSMGIEEESMICGSKSLDQDAECVTGSLRTVWDHDQQFSVPYFLAGQGLDWLSKEHPHPESQTLQVAFLYAIPGISDKENAEKCIDFGKVHITKYYFNLSEYEMTYNSTAFPDVAAARLAAVQEAACSRRFPGRSASRNAGILRAQGSLAARPRARRARSPAARQSDSPQPGGGAAAAGGGRHGRGAGAALKSLARGWGTPRPT